MSDRAPTRKPTPALTRIDELPGPLMPRDGRVLALLVCVAWTAVFMKRFAAENADFPGPLGFLTVDFLIVVAVGLAWVVPLLVLHRRGVRTIGRSVRAMPAGARAMMLSLRPAPDSLGTPPLRALALAPLEHARAMPPTYEQVALRRAGMSANTAFWQLLFVMNTNATMNTETAPQLLFALLVALFGAALFTLFFSAARALAQHTVRSTTLVADADGITASRFLRPDERWAWTTTTAVFLGTAPRTVRVLLCDHEHDRQRTLDVHTASLPHLLGVLHAAQLERQRRAAHTIPTE